MSYAAPKCHYCIVLSTTLADNKLLNALMTSEPETVLAMPDSSLPDGQYKTITALSDLYDRELVGIITWAKQIPGKKRKILCRCILRMSPITSLNILGSRLVNV